MFETKNDKVYTSPTLHVWRGNLFVSVRNNPLEDDDIEIDNIEDAIGLMLQLQKFIDSQNEHTQVEGIE